MMTLEEMKAYMGKDLPGGWDDLAPFLDLEECDCGEDCCEGWVTRYRLDAAAAAYHTVAFQEGPLQ